MNLEKQFIPYEQALALKELGFNDECLAGYIRFSNGSFELAFYKDRNVNFNTTSNIYVSAPTFAQAFRWFREKYGLPSWIYTSNNKEYWYSILKDGRMLVRDYKPFETYEEAELACLIKLIELVKNK